MKNCIRKQIADILKRYILKALIAFLFLIISSAFVFLIPVLTKQLINSILHTEDHLHWSFATFAIILFAFLLLRELFTYFSAYSFETIVRLVTARIRRLLFSTLQYNFEKLGATETGRLLTYVSQDTERLKSFFYPTLVNFLKDVLTLTSAFIAGVYLNPFVTFVSLIPLIFFFILIRFINPKIRNLSSELIESQTEFISRLKEFIEALEVFRVYLKEKVAVKKFDLINDSFTSTDIKRIKALVLFNLPLTVLFHSGYIVALIFGAYLVRNGRMDIGSLFSILMVIGYIYDSSRNLWDFNVHKEEIGVVENRLKDILKLNCDNARKEEFVSVKSVDLLSVRISNFAYSRQKMLLKNIYITASKGQIIGIVGKSGQGKSTLIKIILGLLERNRGFVEINGIPLNKIDINSYYKRIAYLPQNNIVFKGTVKENLLSETMEVNSPLILEILGDIPLEKHVKEQGSNLSGGEKRRIMIARTFIEKDKDVYLLDEPFASLDAENVQKIKKAIRHKVKNSIIFLITHSMDIVKELCNTIVKLD